MKQPTTVLYPIESSYEGSLRQGLKLAIPVSVIMWVLIISFFL